MSKVDYSRTYSLAEVALELGVSRARAYQIEQGALRKARSYLESKGICLSDLVVAPLSDITEEQGVMEP